MGEKNQVFYIYWNNKDILLKHKEISATVHRCSTLKINWILFSNKPTPKSIAMKESVSVNLESSK